jgi:competence protein ComEA
MQEKIISFLKEHSISLGLGAVGVLFLGYGLFSVLGQRTKGDDEISFQSESGQVDASSTAISPKVAKQIVVDIEGAVEKPGVYKLTADSRIQDALIACGGLSRDADRQQVSQNLNLAAPLIDGGKLYIPAVGEQIAGSGISSSGVVGNGSSALGSQTKMVNINTANEAELDGLPGVGPATAQKIISKRPYQKVTELVDKKAVGASVFGKIKDMVSVY